MNIVVFWIKLHWNLFLKALLTICHIGSDNDLAPNSWQAIIWTNDGLVYWQRCQLSLMYGLLTISLLHWGKVTHICVSKLTIIGSDNGLSPGQRQAIIWTNAGILLIWPLGTNFSEISIDIQTFLFKKIHFKMSSGKWRPFCLGLNVLITISWDQGINKQSHLGFFLRGVIWTYFTSIPYF